VTPTHGIPLYGWLVEIFFLLAQYADTITGLDLDFIGLYFKSKSHVAKKLYNGEIHIYRFGTTSFELLTGYLHSGKLPESLHEELHGLYENNKTRLKTNVWNFLALAIFLRMKGEVTEALEYLTKYQSFLSQNYGSFYGGLGNVFQMKMEIYIQIGDKVMAKKCFKQWKKFYPNDPDIEDFEYLIKTTPPSISKTAAAAEVKTRSKCAYFKCQKVESKLREFKACAKCKVAFYCSRKCQKRHWKNGHQESCGHYF